MPFEGRPTGRAIVGWRVQIDRVGRRLALILVHRLNLGFLKLSQGIPCFVARDREQKLGASGIELGALRRRDHFALDANSPQNAGNLLQPTEAALRNEDRVFKLGAGRCHRSLGRKKK